ncbi:succinylglutamate desuccinylase/aspartoacylase family protein [Yunchengibacter salinarum]|uniref:succinylglutamate desuccinylase/aspartoacylase family protein n=1 Tax=Yunchengibacter salinarum TaxID=3133399 RepID=UPI0035B600C9
MMKMMSFPRWCRGVFFSGLIVPCFLLGAAVLAVSAPAALAAPAARATDLPGTPLPASLFGDADRPVRLVDRLDVSVLPPGRHHFAFSGGADNTGMASLVPLIVVRGATDGPRLTLTAGVHGDELNGLRVLHRLADVLDPDHLKGSVLMVAGVNRSGLARGSRYFQSTSSGGHDVDLNRLAPGRITSGDAAERFMARLWRRVLADNTSLAIDLHTQTRGTEYPLFVFADFRRQAVRDMAFQLAPDMIKNDGGQDGTVETAFMDLGVPAVTFEIGAPKRFQDRLVGRALEGIRNVMRGQGLLDGPVTRAEQRPVTGDSFTNVTTPTGGIVVVDVALGQKVARGDRLARLFNPFGEEIRTFSAPVAGHVVARATDPLREPGAMLVRLLH